MDSIYSDIFSLFFISKMSVKNCVFSKTDERHGSSKTIRRNFSFFKHDR